MPSAVRTCACTCGGCRSISRACCLSAKRPAIEGRGSQGVPFASERLLIDGGDPFGLFGADKGYRRATLSASGREASATIVWQTIEQLRTPPLIWNAVPFHSHQSGDPFSNRMPRAEERKLGAVFLKKFIALYPIKRIIAVGNVAAKSLREMGFDCEKVRHPAQGGKPQFVAGLRALLASEIPNDASQGD